MIAQGHRPGNFRPAPDTIAAIESVMKSAGVEVPKASRLSTAAAIDGHWRATLISGRFD